MELPLKQAAARLGVSHSTMKRMVEDGRVRARQDERGWWHVQVGDFPMPSPEVLLGQAGLRGDAAVLGERLRQLDESVAHLRGEVADLRALVVTLTETAVRSLAK